ncbi:MAG: 3'(2'),5'-bisphosphate nucleotidase CysQ [Microthrixaceae bacterium]
MEYSDDDHRLAAQLADGAGRLLVEMRTSMLADGSDAAEVKDAGDRASHEWLMDALTAARPDDAVLSEEATAEESRNSRRLSAERVWVIDPVDGTREYGEGRSDWAVHVALVMDGSPTAAAVSLPALGVVFSSDPPSTAPPAAERLRVVVSRSRPPAEALAVASALGAELIEMGSAGAKAMSILRGEADIYAHSGGQYEWDSCAPVGVATAAGLHCSRLDGSDLIYNRADPYLPDLLICRPEHAGAVLGALEEFWRDGADEDGPAPTASGRDDGDPAVVSGTPAEAKGGVRQ